jgi:hypothetical protein
MIRTRFASALLLLCCSLVSVAGCGDSSDSSGATASVSGDAIPFNYQGDRIEGATVSILELPDKRMVTGADGHFEFDGIPVGSEVSLVMEHPGYHLEQTGTHVVPPEGLERVTFQGVTNDVYAALGAVLGVVPDEEHACQMPTTVTRIGKSLYDPGAHGEEGATVTIDPPLPAEHGPIYFNSSVIPDRSLTETSDDGGVLYVQVPPGEYVMTAHKPGAEFRQVKFKCRAGVLVNASPPWGLQRIE